MVYCENTFHDMCRSYRIINHKSKIINQQMKSILIGLKDLELQSIQSAMKIQTRQMSQSCKDLLIWQIMALILHV